MANVWILFVNELLHPRPTTCDDLAHGFRRIRPRGIPPPPCVACGKDTKFPHQEWPELTELCSECETGQTEEGRVIIDIDHFIRRYFADHLHTQQRRRAQAVIIETVD